MYVQKLSQALETKGPGAHRVNRSNRGVVAAAVMLLLVAALAIGGCARQASGAAPTMEEAIADYGEREGLLYDPSTVDILVVRPWSAGLVVLFDGMPVSPPSWVTSDEKWQWYVYVAPKGDGWSVQAFMGGGDAHHDKFCNHSTTVGTDPRFDIYTGRVCDNRVTQVRIVSRRGESPDLITDVFGNGRFFAVSRDTAVPPCYEALDEDGQVLFRLDIPPHVEGQVPKECPRPE
jgi:hypothetical protein